MPTTLQEAIQNLYDVFAAYPRPEKMCASPVKDFGEAWCVIRSKALHDLPETDLWQYAFSALTTWGDEQDFKYFLPRLLKLTTISEIGAGNELFVPKLSDAKW